MATLLALLVVLAGVATPVAATSYDEYQQPELTTAVQGSNVVVPGETTTLRIGIQNRGTSVTNSEGSVERLAQVFQSAGVKPGAAMATTAHVEAGSAPVDVRTGTQSVGTVAPDNRQQVPVEIEVAENAQPGTYRIPVELEYQYVRAVSVDGDEQFITRRDGSVRTHVTVRVDESVRLGVDGVDGENLRANEDGRVSVTVSNEGSETASDAELMLRENDQLTPRTNGVSLGTLDPGETATADFRVGVADVENTGTYAVPFQLRYEDGNGVVRTSVVRTGSVTIEDAPSFDLSANSTDLYVDSTGEVTLSVTNTGDRRVENARAELQPAEPFSPLSTSASLGTLAPGETGTATFKLEVADRAVAQEYPLTFTIVHEDAYDERVESDSRTVPVTVGPEMTIETSGSPTVAAGATETVEVTITNTGEGVMRDAVARINVNTPFETDDDTAYIGELEPGESTTVTFTVTADGAATPKTYSVDTTVKYDNTFGRTVVSDVTPTAVEVTESEGGLLSTILSFLGL